MISPTLLLIALCAALNLALGSIVFLVKLPIYLDMVGTLLCALLLAHDSKKAFLAAATTGVVSFLLGGVFNPFLPWFSLTVISVAAITSVTTNRSAELLRTLHITTPAFWARILGFGILTGIVAAVVSAPVVVYLFGGVTGSGSALLVAFFLKAGNQLLDAALLSGLSAEPIDKTLQLLLAVVLFRATPMSFIQRLRTSS